MINVFDTHRLLYRNAQLRAFKQSAPTVPLNFLNYDGADIGNIVYTDENGYISYSSNMYTVTELLVNEPAIIQVSLDGGHNWPIQWIVSNNVSQAVERDDIGSLDYYDGDGNVQTWNPLSGNAALPDYVRRDEFDPDNKWQETNLIFPDNGSATVCLVADKWTSVVSIPFDITANTCWLNVSDCRVGQKIVVLAYKNVTFKLDGSIHDSVQLPVNKVAVIGISETEAHVPRALIGVINGITAADAEILIKNLIKTEAGPSRTQTDAYHGVLAESNQTVTCGIAPDVGVYYISLTNTDDGISGVNIVIPNPTHVGVCNIIIDMDYATYHSGNSNSIKLSIGSGAPVEIHNSGVSDDDSTRYQIIVTVLAWTDGTAPYKYRILDIN
jgi:hypothetical protein